MQVITTNSKTNLQQHKTQKARFNNDRYSLIRPASLLREEEQLVHTIYSTVISFTNIPGKLQSIELVPDKPHCFYSGCG